MKRINFKNLVLILALVLSGISSFAAIDSMYVCSGSEFTLRSALTPNINYSWERTVGGTATSDTNTIVQTVTLADPDVFVMNEYVLTIDSANSCSSYDTIRVIILPAVAPDITTPNSSVCSNEAALVELTASVGTLTLPAGITVGFTWGGGATGTGTTATVSVPEGATTDVGVTVTPACSSGLFARGNNKLTGCYTNGTFTITRSAPPTIPTISFE